MKLAPQNIRSQILVGFSALIVLILINLLISYQYLEKQARLNNDKELIQETKAEMLNLYNKQLFFVENNFLDSNLYIQTKEYQPLISQEKDYLQLAKKIEALTQNQRITDIIEKEDLHALINDAEKVQSIFSQIITLQIEKGFKNWGYIGKMRKNVHLIEDKSLIPIADLLFMRRHEKDYLLRRDKKYFHELIKIKENISAISTTAEASTILDEYVYHFAAIVKIDEQLGDFYNKGLKLALLTSIDITTRDFKTIIDKYKLQQQQIASSIKWSMLLSGIFITIVALIISIIVARKISKPLKMLIAEINGILKNESSFHIQKYKSNTYKEIVDLVIAFNHLMNKINRQISKINNNSEQLVQQNEALSKVNKELDQFVYSASHDLRSPLTTMAGLINIIKLEKQENLKKEYINRMGTLIKRLDNFIIDILNLSRNARLDVEYQEVDLEHLIQDIFDNYDLDESAITIEKQVFVDKRTPNFYTDKARVKVILNNLISNSLKYVDQSKPNPFVKISISIDNERAFIKIADNGIGIKKKYIPKLFDMFFRANNTVKGSGLGLYIVKESLEKIGGTINMTSEYTQGTVFNLFIPNHANKIAATPKKQIAQQAF